MVALHTAIAIVISAISATRASAVTREEALRIGAARIVAQLEAQPELVAAARAAAMTPDQSRENAVSKVDKNSFTLIGGVFFDPANSSAVLEEIARVLPISHLVEGLRDAMVGGSGLGDQLGGLAVLVLWGAVGMFFAVRGFSWDQKRE